MAWANKTYTFSPSTTISSAQVNQNFDDLVSGLDTAMPSGGIIIWSGAVASIPSGWYLCNGANSTADLRGKFVYGAGGSYSVGATGGAETVSIAHTHAGPSHTHTYSGTTSNNDAAVQVDSTNEEAVANHPHAHTYSGTTSADGTGNTGGMSANATPSILPPYHALAYIMKS